jgi:hypothetical protein
MHASVNNFRQPDALGKLLKQAIASTGAIQPTAAAEWLNYMTLTDLTLKRFDEILGAKVGKAPILTDARTGQSFPIPWCTWQAAQASNRVHRAVQPTIVSEWLVWIIFERLDEILGTKVGKASILTDARIGR